MNKAGISPVIATVLLISIVVVAGVIIAIALLGFGGDQSYKFGNPVEEVCREGVSFDASLSGSELTIENTGSVGILKIKAYDSEGDSRECLIEVPSGRTKSTSDCGSDIEKVSPVIPAEDEDENSVEYICEDQEFFL